MYGKELILDLHNCDISKFNRVDIEIFFIKLCDLIKVERGDLFFWDDVGVPEEEKQIDPKTTGTSAVQFILTSSIVLHTLDLLGKVFINIFSCDEFNFDEVSNFVQHAFGGIIRQNRRIQRW